MSKITNKKRFAQLICLMLAAAMAFSMVGCGASKTAETAAETLAAVETTEAPAETASAETEAEPAAEAAATAVYTEDTELGEGSKTFTFIATAAEDNKVTFTVHSDAATVGEALLALNLIAGEESSYGLYVKTVNGVTADYDTDGHYWAFYIDGEYASTGVDATELTDGAVYAFTVE